MGKRGVMLVVVMVFACTIGVGLFFLIQSGTTVAAQNKKTLFGLQAYYLSESAVQHASLVLRVLPLDAFRALKKNSSGRMLKSVASEIHGGTRLPSPATAGAAESYDLFFDDPPDNMVPYGGEYELEEITLQGTHKGLNGAQDQYRIKVKSAVYPNPDRKRGKVGDTLDEELIVSRFTGGIGSP